MTTQTVRLSNGTDITVKELDNDQINQVFQSQSFTGKKLLLEAVKGTPRNRLKEVTGLSNHTIGKYFRTSNLLFRDTYYQLIHNYKADIKGYVLEVAGLARSQAINSLMQMVQISEQSESESMRLQASREILTLAGSYKDTLAQPQSIQQMLVTISQLDHEVSPSDNIPGGTVIDHPREPA
jgi:hypothetical protein